MTFEMRFQHWKKRFSGAFQNPPEELFAIAVTLTDLDGKKLYIANTGAGFEIAPYDYIDYTAAIETTADRFTRLLNGSLSAERAAADGRIAARGNLEHVKLLHRIADRPPRRMRAAG